MALTMRIKRTFAGGKAPKGYRTVLYSFITDVVHVVLSRSTRTTLDCGFHIREAFTLMTHSEGALFLLLECLPRGQGSGPQK